MHLQHSYFQLVQQAVIQPQHCLVEKRTDLKVHLQQR